MTHSVPIHRLKQRARTLSKERGIPLHEALDQIARTQGFQSWSHLSSEISPTSPVEALFSKLEEGDMALIGARPGQGKTLLVLELLVRAARQGIKSWFFTLDYTLADVETRLNQIGAGALATLPKLTVDTSDQISSTYIIEQLTPVQDLKLVAIDYLQILDQKRSTPPLADQVEQLARFAAQNRAIVVAISQIDRRFAIEDATMPDLTYIRQPNAANLSAFTKACFLHDGKTHLACAS